MTSLSILFQDDWLVAIDKPAGYLVHPSDTPKPDDLVAMKILRDQIGKKIHVLHRLDQPTSGVVLFAIDQDAAKKVCQAFEKRKIEKNYLAVVHGHPLQSIWTCELPLRKKSEDPEKPALTFFEVLEQLSHNLALVRAQPLSGRYHQIRRHLLYSGHPIVGDFRYHEVEECHTMGQQLGTGSRMLLQAKSLALVHPITKEQILIEAPLDPLIAKLSQKNDPPLFKGGSMNDRNQ